MTSRGEVAAHGRRQRIRPILRKAAYAGLSRRSLAGELLSGHPVGQLRPAPSMDAIELAPGLQGPREASDVAARVNWYLRGCDVPIVAEGAEAHDISPDSAPWMDPALVRRPDWRSPTGSERPLTLQHRLDPRGAGTLAAKGRRALLADPRFYYAADLGWVWARWFFGSMPAAGTPAAVERLFALGGPGSTALALATGPSAERLDPKEVTAEVRITCNSAVRDRDLIQALRPNVICFGDPVFHYGPSRYAAAFREDLLRAVDEVDPVLVTLDLWGGLLLEHHPELADRLVLIRTVKGSVPWRWPDRHTMEVRQTGNVLTNLMLPAAFALADQVEIAGCDGRDPNETYFWQHNQRTQYGDLMGSAFDAHEAFFRDRSYVDYYEQHCRELEEFLTVGEAAGKRSRSVTPSHIPALVSRGAPAF